jgi:hypothetical protein
LFGLYLFNQVLTAWRWKTLLKLTGIREPLRNLTIAVLYGQTINKLLPSSIGGDSARIAYLFKVNPGHKTAALSATLMDRLLAFLALFLLGFIALPFSTVLDSAQRWAAGMSLVILFGLLGLVFWGAVDHWVQGVIGWTRIPDRFQQALARFWQVFLTFRSQKQALLGALTISLLRQGLMLLNLYLLFKLLGAQVKLIDLFLVIPVVTVLVILPISIGGIGVREAALAVLLGISSESVLSFTLIRYSFIILVPLILLVETFLPGEGKIPSDHQEIQD